MGLVGCLCHRKEQRSDGEVLGFVLIRNVMHEDSRMLSQSKEFL